MMQIFLNLKNNRILDIPVNYNYHIQSAIYSALRRWSPEYSEMFHNKGYSEFQKYKFFTFGPLRCHYRYENKRMYIDSDIILEIRSISSEFCNILLNSLMQSGRMNICRYDLELEKIVLKDNSITDNSIRITMDTPVIAMQQNEKQTIFRSPFEKEFPEILSRNFINKYNACCGCMPDETIMIKCNGSYKSVRTKYKSMFITAFKGDFELTGKPEYLSFLYDVGLGIKTSSGFGMFSVMRK